MKNNLKIVLAISTTAVLTCIITIILCNKPHPHYYAQPTNSLDTYSLSIAQADITNCQTIYNSILASDTNKIDTQQQQAAQIIAYTVHAEDLLKALGISDSITVENCAYKHIRVYLGYHINDDGGHTAGFKLFIVPVKDAHDIDSSACTTCGGNDMLWDYNSKKWVIDTLIGTNTNNIYVLDLNAPCPNICDNASQLMPNYGFKKHQ